MLPDARPKVERSRHDVHHECPFWFACYAESKDGIHWTRPDLGLFEFNGSRNNNIIVIAGGLDNSTPFKDTRPDCPADQRYKAARSRRTAGVSLGRRHSLVEAG